MAKELKDWIDEFVENGANPKNVVKWPEEAGGGSSTKVVTELPEVGEEHIIYELQEKKKIPSLIPRVNQQMVNDGVFNELMLFVFVFDTREDMTNALIPIIPEGDFPLCLNYIIKEDKLIVSIYGDTEWQFAEVTKVSDYKFDLSNVSGGGSSVYLVMLKEYLGKSSEEGEDVKHAGKLLNDELYTFEPNTFGILLGAPTSGIMVLNYRYEVVEMPVEMPEEYTFEYIPYEKILKNQLAEVTEGMNVLWMFKPNGTGEAIASSYWIYANKKWFNTDDIGLIKLQDKTVNPASNTQEITADTGYDGLGTVTVTSTSGVTYNSNTLSVTLPKAIARMGISQVGSNVYLFGGEDTSSSFSLLNTIYKFNTDTETITKLSTTLPQSMSETEVAQVGSNVYLFGGFSSKYLNTIYKFDTETETISKLDVTLPEALTDMCAASVGSSVYLFGGNSSGNNVNTIYKFNTETETISALSITLPEAMSDIGISQVGSNVYLFGGFSSKYFKTIYKFNTNTEILSELSTKIPYISTYIGTSSVGSNVYLFGVADGGDGKSDSIYKFNTETETISKLDVTLPEEIQGARAATVGNKAYLFGAIRRSGLRNTIYKFKIDF